MTRGSHKAGSPAAVAVLVAALTLVSAACGGAGSPSSSPASPPVAGVTSSPVASLAGRPQVVIDTDMSLDDTMALPFLLREPGIDVLAVTVVGTGLVHCLDGLQVVARIMATLRSGDIPTSCGRSEPLAGTHAFPDAWRAAADDGYGLALERSPVSVPDQTAPELIGSIAASSARPITVVALGPLTNLAEALQGNPGLASRIERIVAMGGAVDVPGNVSLGAEGSPPLAAEWNVYADPTAADIVFRSGMPITLVPLDATNQVPVTQEFVSALEADHAAAPADIVYELLARRGVLPGDYFWDPLASVVVVDEAAASMETIKLRIVTAEGPDSGRTARADDGVPVQVALTADRAAFEERFLAGLRVGAARPTPFTLAGTIAVRFDGTTCVDERPATMSAGDWMLEASTTAAGTSAVVVMRFHEGAGWDQLLAYIRTAKDPTAQPDFLDVAGLAGFDAPGTSRAVVDLVPGHYGIVCLDVAGTTPRAVPASGAFEVAP
jgi:pyrimidine-specific ribonucleoside hydrolase